MATPGRLAEIIFRLEKLRLGNVKSVIIDEVDNMLNEPYIGEIETILQATPLFKRRMGDVSGDTEVTESDDDDVGDAQETSKSDSSKGFICLASATGNNPDVAAFADKYLSADWSIGTLFSCIFVG